MVRRTSAMSLHRSDRSTISASGEGEKFGGRLARSLAIMDDRLRHALDDIAAAGRAHQAGNADALAAFDQNFGQRQRDDQGAVKLGVTHQRRSKNHRRRAIRPDPDGVRGFPFEFAHVEMIVARGAPPIDPRRRLAGDKAAVLPEILAGSGAAAAVQSVNHRRRDAPRFQDQSRHGGGERAAFADRTLHRRTIVIGRAPCLGRHPFIRSAPSAARSPPRWSRPRRAPRR